MKFCLIKVVVLLCLFLMGVSCTSASIAYTDLDTIIHRLAQDLNEHPSDSIVLEAFNQMMEDGTYEDVDYNVTTQETLRGWIPKWHLYRIVTIASAYADSNSPFYRSEALLNKIELGLKAWVRLKPRSSNWWVGTIHEPIKLGSILVLIKSEGGVINNGIVTDVLEIMRNAATSPYDYNDANRFDVALHWLYRSCLEIDEETMNTAVKCIFELLDVGETGFQVDGSFFHDGPQFFIGGYCVNSVLGVVGVASALRESSFELVGERLDVLRKFFLETWISAARGGLINYDCYGRAISQQGIYYDLIEIYKKMALIDPDYEEEYMKAISCLEGVNDNYKILHHHFYRGDYTTYSCPKYNLSVRLFSNRTQQLESGSGANLKGYFLCNGNTSITITGREYYDVCGLWNWNFIPGVTAPIIESVPAPKKNWGVMGSSSFAGGVSDSIRGVTAFSYYDDYNGMNTGGNKGWFFFGDEVVCLGSNIQSDHQAVTTVEQCWGHDDMGIFSVSDNACVVHNGVGYYFPSHSTNDLMCKNETVLGNWHDINSTQKDSVISGQVFLLAINHDLSKPQGHNYSYIIVPGTSEAQMKKYISKSDIEICSNTDSLQVVRHKSLGIWEMIFYKGCTFRHSDLELSASYPCAVIYKYGSDGKPIVHVSDPGQTGMDININVNDYMIGRAYDGTISFDDTPKEYWGATKVANLKETTTGINSLLMGACNGKGIIYDVNGRLIHSFKGEDIDVLKNKIKYPGLYILKMRGQCGSQKLIVR